VYIAYVSVLSYNTRVVRCLQSGAIPLTLKVEKNRNIRFVGIFIASVSCEFYYDYVTVTSFINIKYGYVATEIVP